MSKILSRISNVIITSEMHIQDNNQFLDGIRNLVNGIISYPKDRTL